MLHPPAPVEVLPSLEHNGIEIICRIHHGFSSPQKGPPPAARYLYGAKSESGERHWRNNLHDLQQLIDSGFAGSPSEDATS